MTRTGQIVVWGIATTQHIDVFPTVVDSVGLSVPKETRGITLLPLLRGEPSAVLNNAVISHAEIPRPSWSIRTDTHRLIEITYPEGVYRALYDLRTDPAEQTSIASKDHETVTRLTTLLHQTMQSQPVYEPTAVTFVEWDTPQQRKSTLERQDSNR